MPTQAIIVSIVIPFLNELEQLTRHYQYYLWLREEAQIELLFVDGGSTDGSGEWLLTQEFQVLSGVTGRARQMNLGAARATGKVILFLHADSVLPVFSDGKTLIDLLAPCADGGSNYLWGRFDVHIESKCQFLVVVASMMNWRSRISGIATGDQGIFVRQTVFKQIGAYPDTPLMEDIALCKKLRKLSAPLCLAEKITTSGRRWEQRGLWRTIGLMWLLRAAYFLGVPITWIAKQYR